MTGRKSFQLGKNQLFEAVSILSYHVVFIRNINLFKTSNYEKSNDIQIHSTCFNDFYIEKLSLKAITKVGRRVKVYFGVGIIDGNQYRKYFNWSEFIMY